MSRPSFRCFVIGSDTLLLECIDHLLAAGHSVLGVVTDTPRIAEWAEARGLRAIDPDQMVGALAAEPFDHLFAITWLRILPDEVLDLARGYAINFHDGPLPAYAGLNAPAWALMHEEKEYGVTWHIMTSGVDEGDIALRTPVAITPEDTSLSLNMKCFAAAREGFPLLVDGLADGTLQTTPQPSGNRSFFGRHDRPDHLGLLDWRRPAAELAARVRALDFGPYANPLGCAKLITADGRAWIVTRATRVADGATAEARSATPGTVLAVRSDAFVVATGHGHLEVAEVRPLDGGPPVGPSAGGMRVRVGDVLPAMSERDRSSFEELSAALSRSESFWLRRLRTMVPAELPDRLPAPDGETPAAPLERIPLRLASATDPGALLAAWAVVIARLSGRPAVDLGWLESTSVSAARPVVADWRPIRLDLQPETGFDPVVDAAKSELAEVRRRGGFLLDVLARSPDLDGSVSPGSCPLPLCAGPKHTGQAGVEVMLELGEGSGPPHLVFAPDRLSEARAATLARSVECVVRAAAADPAAPWSSLPLVDDETLQLLLEGWNDTGRSVAERYLHEGFERQAREHPDRVALRDGDRVVSYGQLDRAANGVASHLHGLGIGPDSVVGLHIGRSIEMVVAALGVLKAGAAYLPLDPEFPEDRRAFMLSDVGAHRVLTAGEVVLPAGIEAIDVRALPPADDPPASGVAPEDLAYVIYTSGSTGRPKGVLVEHRNAANFFAGMDDVIEHDPPGVWLAVTSLSFDISVLELFWTLARGFEVVLHREPSADDPQEASAAAHAALAERGMEFGLFMWGNDDGPGRDKYRLMLEAGRYFDENGFDSAWTPERHFHAFGGPFPNPAVTGAALAAITCRLAIRSGSCVSPLHHPIRIAEEWAVVDNLSEGRVGLAFAAGWQPNDFVLRPESYPDQKQVMMDQIDTVRRLWRGEAVEFENPLGKKVALTTLPRPVQPELPFWITTAGNPDTYRAAGAMGANVLTHLLGQSFDEVAEKIAVYREARAEAGLDPDEGTITLMLHTFVGSDDAEVRELVREPMKDYLRASMKLVLGFAWTFPAFKRPGGPDSTPDDIDLGSLSDEETEAILDFAFDRYYETSGLFGTPETCLDIVARCAAIGVDEIACLLDFGVPTETVLEGLPHLKAVRDAANAAPATTAGNDGASRPHDAVVEWAPTPARPVTHLQCTPSMARLFTQRSSMGPLLHGLEHMFVGGEAFPNALSTALRATVKGTVTNMYGPTETTIWSTTHRVERDGAVPIGRPIANTRIYVLDDWGQPVPPGLPGDLWIGGEGVVRGYHARPELTDSRFRSNPFHGGRMYATGDRARWSRDGVLEFLGRVDDQVKIRGYRIELGEIEAVLESRPDVRESAVVVREDSPGDQRLVAYVVPDGDWAPEALREAMLSSLPAYMVPAQLVRLDALPLTPNRKTDRKALLALSAAPTRSTPVVAPTNDLETTLVEAWKEVLGLDDVGTEDNFFDAGGHSLLVVQLHRLLGERLDARLSLVDLYRWPTIRALSDELTTRGGGASGDAPTAAIDAGSARGARRREMMRRRRGG